jgi:hypothetical protein
MLDVFGGLIERCGCQEVKGPFWNHPGGSKSFVQDQVCVLMHSKPAAKQQTNQGLELKQRAAKRRPSTLWRSVQQRDPHQISQQQSLGSYDRG